MRTAIKRMGDSGQICLGDQYAGRDALVEEIEEGVWLIKIGTFIPDDERWLHEPEARAKLDRAIEWAKRTPPRETDLDALEAKLREGRDGRSGPA